MKCSSVLSVFMTSDEIHTGVGSGILSDAGVLDGADVCGIR